MNNGFTLVETLVALFVFGLLAAASVVIIGNSADTQLRLTALSNEVQDMQRFRAALRADLAQSADRITRDERGQRTLAFTAGGKDGRLFAFVRRGWENPDGAPRASLQFVEYRHEDGALVRRARPMVDGAEFGDPAVLVRDIDAVLVAYRDGDAWRDTWDPKKAAAIPIAVQIDLTTARFGIVRQLFLTEAAR